MTALSPLQKDLKHTINLHPSYFGPSTNAFLEQKLYADVEGTCSGKYGYIVAVINIVHIGPGTIQPGAGLAQFIVDYKAIVYRPFKGEVMDGIIKNVGKVRRLSFYQHPDLTRTQMGIFADVGPVQVFISSHVRRVAVVVDFTCSCLV
jgi:DNA-directed RNA polymerase II subunit RPB7